MVNTDMINKRRRFNIKMRRRRRKFYIVAFLLLISICSSITYYFFVKNDNTAKYLSERGCGNYNIKNLQSIRKDYEDKLNINEVHYEFSTDLEGGNKPTALVLHHTASVPLTPQKINEMHIQKGWEGIGYHFYIRKDGTIYRGRPENSVGAHAIGRNRDSIGICLEGNFEEEQVNDKQKKALVKLCTDMIIKYNMDSILGHRDVYGTLCPGANFPMEEVKKDVEQEMISLYKNN